MRLWIALSFLVGGGVALAAVVPQDSNTRLMNEVAAGDLAQIDLGRLALARSSDPNVRQLATRMIDEHSKSYQQLKLIADRKGLPFPTQMWGNHKQLHNDLASMYGSAFDLAYVSQATFAREDTVAKLERARGTIDDPALADFIARNLPQFKQQAAQAQRRLDRM
jgi:putative membrane protein